jgi:predicted amidohydrolase
MKVAAVQMDVKILDREHNLARVLQELETAAGNGAELVVFPECALTGYCFASRDEAMGITETVPGPSTERILGEAKRLNCYAVVGMLERRGSEVFNAAAVIGPEGILGSYHKVHMPFLGIDRYNTLGDELFPVYETRFGKVGVNICFDMNFPESARSAKLRGARLLAVPTNWPTGTNTYKHVVNSRGQENHMFVVAANRVGTERGFGFTGHSKIVDLWGETVAEADGVEETILYGEFDLAEADQNHVVWRPGEWELDRIGDRRPEFYTILTESLAEERHSDRKAQPVAKTG